MADHLPQNNPSSSDEIELGQLLTIIKKGFYQIGDFTLRVFVYLKKNAFKLLGLIILGIGISIGLSVLVPEKKKTEVIVKPNSESTNYLYDVIDEIDANIKSRDETFFETLGISINDLAGFKIQVREIEEEEEKTEEELEEQMKYLDVLKNFKNESFVIDILRAELSQKSVVQHKITFIYQDSETGPAVVDKLLDYINSNSYFDELQQVYAENAKTRIEMNTGLIKQIDEIISNYANTLLVEPSKTAGSTVYLEKENALNVTGLLNLKNSLIKEIEVKRLQLNEQTKALSIINQGKSQQLKRSFFNQKIVMFPMILLLAFFLLSFLQYLNRKAKKFN